MSARMRLLVTAVLVGLVLAPVTQAREWRGHGRDYGHHHGGGDAGAAIIGGLIGLGLGAAIASGVLAETRPDSRCWRFDPAEPVIHSQAAISFSFANGSASRKVCIGVLPKHQRPWCGLCSL